MYYMSHTEDYVKEMFIKIGIFTPQQLNFLHISNKLGIKIFYWNEPSQAVFIKDYSYIFLNQYLSDQQKWQDFCHELGHVLLHVGNQKRMTKSFRDYQEAKANHFMYHTCVPSFMLSDLKSDYLSTYHISKKFNVTEDFARIRLEQYMNKASILPIPM